MSSLENIYSKSKLSVRRSQMDVTSAENTYKQYVEFVFQNTNSSTYKVLDIGCGNGWSTFLLSKKFNEVIGLDVHASAFEPETNDKLKYIQGSTTNIPFVENTFDAVCTNECLEHVEDIKKALQEIDRVLKPDGIVIIVGPNLFSLAQSWRGLTNYVWKNRPVTTIFFRNKNMPFHPHGNTIPEIILYLFRNLYYIFILFFNKAPLFLKRTPDLNPPFHADNDACYFLNPYDLNHFFGSLGYKIKSQISFKSILRSGTLFTARKKSIR